MGGLNQLTVPSSEEQIARHVCGVVVCCVNVKSGAVGAVVGAADGIVLGWRVEGAEDGLWEGSWVGNEDGNVVGAEDGR